MGWAVTVISHTHAHTLLRSKCSSWTCFSYCYLKQLCCDKMWKNKPDLYIFPKVHCDRGSWDRTWLSCGVTALPLHTDNWFSSAVFDTMCKFWETTWFVSWWRRAESVWLCARFYHLMVVGTSSPHGDRGPILMCQNTSVHSLGRCVVQLSSHDTRTGWPQTPAVCVMMTQSIKCLSVHSFWSPLGDLCKHQPFQGQYVLMVTKSWSHCSNK